MNNQRYGAGKTIRATIYFILTVMKVVTISMTTTTAASATEETSTTIIPNPVLRYDFTTESCLKGYFENQGTIVSSASDEEHGAVSSRMIRNPNTTLCSSVGIGVEPTTSRQIVAQTVGVPRLEGSSITLMESVLQELRAIPTSNGITISLWIQPFPLAPDTISPDENEDQDDDDNDSDNVVGAHEISNPPIPILSIGSSTTPNTDHTSADTTSTSNSESPVNECDKHNIDFELRAHGNGYNDLEVYFRTKDPFFQPCYKINVPNAFQQNHNSRSSIYHLAIVLGNEHQEVFVNGQSTARIYSEPFHSKLNHWNTADSLIQIFPSRPNTLPWNGRIFSLSLLPGILEDITTVHQLLSDGIVMSSSSSSSIKPYTSSKLIRMMEDNNNNGRLNDPSTYPVIELPIGYVKDDEDMLLRSLQIEPKNPTPTLRSYVTKLPSKGQLYHIDGTPLLVLGDASATGPEGNNATVGEVEDNKNVLIPILGGSNQVVFVPGFNEHSLLPDAMYATFEYCVSVSQQRLFSSSQCQSTVSTISIIVDPVNDPPIAKVGREDQGFYKVHEGIIEESTGLYLLGTDGDVDDYVTSIQITSPPKFGYLYLSVTTFRDDGLLHGTLLSDISNTIPGSEAFVEYRYQNYSPDRVLLDGGAPITDSFQFRVRDNGGDWSEDTTAFVQILPALDVGVESLPFKSRQFVAGEIITTIEACEGEDVMIQLSGRDKSGLDRKVGFFIESVSMQGMLTDPNNHDQEIETGALLHLPKETGDQEEIGFHSKDITFVPSPDLCATEFDANVTFSYRFVALQGGGDDDDNHDGLVVSASDVYEQRIHITCNTAPIHLHVPRHLVAVNAYNSFLNDKCSGYVFNASETDPESCPPQVAIFSKEESISITSDKNLTDDVLFVSLLTQNAGYLTINREQRRHVKMIDDQGEMRQSVRFYTQSNMLNDVLSYLHFQSDEPGLDGIEIELQYGNSCTQNETILQTEDASQPGHHQEQCFTIKKTIEIEVLPPDNSHVEYLDTNFPYLPLPFTLTMMLMIKFKGKLREKNILKTEDIDRFVDEPVPTMDYDDDEEEQSSISGSSHPQSVRWKQYYDDESGFYYYENIHDGTITWDVPPMDEGFIPAEEENVSLGQKMV